MVPFCVVIKVIGCCNIKMGITVWFAKNFFRFYMKLSTRPSSLALEDFAPKPLLKRFLPVGVLFLLFAVGLFWFLRDNPPKDGQVRPAPDSAVYTYAGDAGVQVRSLRLNSADSDQFIIQLLGINGPHNGRIFRCTQTMKNNEMHFATVIDDEKFTIFIVEMGEGIVFQPNSNSSYLVSHVGNSKSWAEVQAFAEDYSNQENLAALPVSE